MTNLPCPVGFGLPTHPPVGVVNCDVCDAAAEASDMVATISVSTGNAMQRSHRVYGTTMPLTRL